jgi:hypothetical protein
MPRINLIIEKAKDGNLWGRVNFRNNLMIDFASTVERLENKMRKLIKKFYGVYAEFDHEFADRE